MSFEYSGLLWPDTGQAPEVPYHTKVQRCYDKAAGPWWLRDLACRVWGLRFWGLGLPGLRYGLHSGFGAFRV